METLYNVLIIGATGLVGNRLIEILLENRFPIKKLKLVASPSSINKKIVIQGNEYRIEQLDESSFEDIDFCFFCSNAELSKTWGRYAQKRCKYVIDNSSYFRMNEGIPLIIPEINFEDVSNNLIANPNCSTIQSLLVLNEIRKIYKLKKILYSTYQSCSGGGRGQLVELLNSYSHTHKKLFDYYLCDTCISQIGNMDINSYSTEEMKMIKETKKIFKDENIEVHANCIRVPVPYCHGVFIYVETEETININSIVQHLSNSNRLKYCPDDKILYFQESYQSSKVMVGRIKKDLDKDNAFSLFCVGDNLEVGAAYNAYNIALNLLKEKK